MDEGEIESTSTSPPRSEGMGIARIIIADENEGRRNLLANTFEREGFEVTRLGTLTQALATAAAVIPEVLLLEGEWSQGSVMDVCQNLSSQAKFRTSTRIVVLSKTTAPDFLSAAAQSGVAEVIGKPVDMNQLVAQISRHASKQFVAPPAQIPTQTRGGTASRFDVGLSVNDTDWALPMLRGLVESGNIDEQFMASIRADMSSISSDSSEEGLSAGDLTTMLRLALNKLVGAGASMPTRGTSITSSSLSPTASTSTPTFNSLQRGATLGESPAPSLPSGGLKSAMEEILEKQADDLASEVESRMEGILSEQPEFITLLDPKQQVFIDPEALELTRLTTELLHDLMISLQQPGALSDLTLLTQIEDAQNMAADVLMALPAKEEEE